MRVFKEQLSSVYDTWIILYRPQKLDMSEDGIIGYIGNETNADSDALYTSDNVIIAVYNDSNDLEENIFEIDQIYRDDAKSCMQISGG